MVNTQGSTDPVWYTLCVATTHISNEITWEQKEYLKALVSHYDDLISISPRNQLVNIFLNFIKEEKYSTKKKLRKIREKKIECLNFGRNYQWFN